MQSRLHTGQTRLQSQDSGGVGRRSQGQALSQLQSESGTSLGYVRSYLKKGLHSLQIGTLFWPGKACVIADKMIPLHAPLLSQVTWTAAEKSQTSVTARPQATEARKQNYDSQWSLTVPKVKTGTTTHKSGAGKQTPLPICLFPGTHSWLNSKLFGTVGRSLHHARRIFSLKYLVQLHSLPSMPDFPRILYLSKVYWFFLDCTSLWLFSLLQSPWAWQEKWAHFNSDMRLGQLRLNFRIWLLRPENFKVLQIRCQILENNSNICWFASGFENAMLPRARGNRGPCSLGCAQEERGEQWHAAPQTRSFPV